MKTETKLSPVRVIKAHFDLDFTGCPGSGQEGRFIINGIEYIYSGEGPLAIPVVDNINVHNRLMTILGMKYYSLYGRRIIEDFEVYERI